MRYLCSMISNLDFSENITSLDYNTSNKRIANYGLTMLPTVDTRIVFHLLYLLLQMGLLIMLHILGSMYNCFSASPCFCI